VRGMKTGTVIPVLLFSSVRSVGETGAAACFILIPAKGGGAP
jgi:hypothetical protein